MSDQLTPEEEEKILHGKPIGTFVLLFVFGLLFLGGWLLMYLALFLGHGPVS